MANGGEMQMELIAAHLGFGFEAISHWLNHGRFIYFAAEFRALEKKAC